MDHSFPIRQTELQQQISEALGCNDGKTFASLEAKWVHRYGLATWPKEFHSTDSFCMYSSLEQKSLEVELIDQAIVYGDNKPYLVALLVLNNEKNIIEDIEIKNEIEKINKNLTKIEKIKKFIVIKEKFSIENGMLTPTLKLKRYKIIQKYKTEFERNY